jgi:hypothetical protein
VVGGSIQTLIPAESTSTEYWSEVQFQITTTNSTNQHKSDSKIKIIVSCRILNKLGRAISDTTHSI